MGAVADRFFGQPTAALQVIGVTGTNGKTSVSHYIAEVLSRRGSSSDALPQPCGLIGTLGYGLYGAVRPGAHTTPDAIGMHRQLQDVWSKGARWAVMEVSSHGLDQGRIEGIRFNTAVFTNLTRDHLDYHGSMTAYAATKRRLFEVSGLRYAVINADDPFGRELIEAMPPGPEVFAYGLHGGLGDFQARDFQNGGLQVRGHVVSSGRSDLVLRVETPWGQGEIRAPVLGRFNGSNVMAAVAALGLSGIPMEELCAAMGELSPVPGRMQPFGGTAGEPLVVVDYAHTPGAMEAVLEALRVDCEGALWCVFGCGGERDTGKRRLMGAAAAQRADFIVLTDDNPRNEDGDGIIDDILQGIPKGVPVFVERERSEAVRRAIDEAGPKDVILVAGKGHETYQDLGDVTRPFSDAAAVRAALKARSG